MSMSHLCRYHQYLSPKQLPHKQEEGKKHDGNNHHEPGLILLSSKLARYAFASLNFSRQCRHLRCMFCRDSTAVSLLQHFCSSLISPRALKSLQNFQYRVFAISQRKQKLQKTTKLQYTA